MPRLALLVAVGALVLAAAAGATTQPSMIVGVKVSLDARGGALSPSRVGRGVYVQFAVRNATRARRVFSVAGRSIVVPALRRRLLVLFFDARGRYRYVSRGGGMTVHGVFVVS